MDCDIQFFNRLNRYYQEIPDVNTSLERYIAENKHPSIPDRKIFYHAFIDKLIRILHVPHNAASSFRELRPLYRLIDSIDPHYFLSDQLQQQINQCPSLTDFHKTFIRNSIRAFLKIIQKTSFNPENLTTPDSMELWFKVFPEGHEWDVLVFLEQQGLWSTASYLGYQAWYRYSKGMPGPNELSCREWNQLCYQVGKTPRETAIINIKASAFAGELEYLNIPGFCQKTPNCDACPLNQDCAWRQQIENNHDHTPSMTAAVHKNQFDNFNDVDLIAHLFSLNTNENNLARSQLPQNSTLRYLDQKKSYELNKLFPYASRFPEKAKILLELCKRYNEEKLIPGSAFHSSHDIFQHFKYRLRDYKQEMFLIVLLDNKHQYLTELEITRGILNKSLVHPREVFSGAIENRAAAIICIHNHPSGDPKPSPEDIKITQRLIEVGKVVGIPVLDHIIIGNDRYYSLADEGML